MDRHPDEKISLNPQQGDFVHRQVQSGRFSTPSDVVNEAVRRMAEMEQAGWLEAELGVSSDEIRRKVEEGLAAADRGEFADFDEVMDELDELDRAEQAQKRKKAS